ncbi:MAG: hypothetical protein JXA82_08150 [Sedimentisphaerales bacterium]|nr:hypothetical protein [Sedimentisphaerales bacterium]
MRTQFADHKGWSDLSMLKAPSKAEIDQLSRAVAIMTPSEKNQAVELTDEQVRRIADDARVDPALFAIFINGYVLACRNGGKLEDEESKARREKQ